MMDEMNFGEATGNILRILTFQRQTIARVARTMDATAYALLWIALGGVLNVIHQQFTSKVEPILYLVSPVLLILSTVLVVSILHTIARLLGGNGSFFSMLRVFGFTLPITWLLLLPLGSNGLLIVAIWLILLSIHLVSVVQQLSFARATWVIMLPLLATVGLLIGTVFFLGESLLLKLI